VEFLTSNVLTIICDRAVGDGDMESLHKIMDFLYPGKSPVLIVAFLNGGA